MSTSSITPSLASLINTTPFAPAGSETPSFPVVAAPSTASSTPDTTTQATDLAALLKSLAEGDAAGSQTALTRLEKDLGLSGPGGSSTSAGSSSGSSSGALSELLAAVSHLVSTGNTSGALQALVGYLKQTATQGTLFNTSV